MLTNESVVLGLGLAIVLAGCGLGQADPQGAPEDDPIALLQGLSERGRCYVSALDARDDPRTECMADCIRSGRGTSIGGGCFHVCYAYQPPPLPPRSTFDHCPAHPLETPGPSAEVECRGGSGEMLIRGTFHDEATHRPVGRARVSLWQPGEARDFSVVGRILEVTTDSTGRFEIPVPVDEFEVMLRAYGYLHPPNVVLSLDEGESCTLTVPLRAYRAEGF